MHLQRQRLMPEATKRPNIYLELCYTASHNPSSRSYPIPSFPTYPPILPFLSGIHCDATNVLNLPSNLMINRRETDAPLFFIIYVLLVSKIASPLSAFYRSFYPPNKPSYYQHQSKQKFSIFKILFNSRFYF